MGVAMSDRIEVDVAVIGAGHAGLNAIKEIRKVTDRYVLINGGGLGTTCARVGCMPSKVAIHLAEVYESRHRFARYGIAGAADLRVDHASAMEHVRDLRDTFVDLVLANTTDEMGDELIEGYARFIDARTLQVGDRSIAADRIVIATGASTIVPEDWRDRLGERLLTVETIFEQEQLPASVAVIGLGPIGIEIGQALHRLGVRVVGIESGEFLARLDDPVVNRAALDILTREFPVWLGHPAQLEPDGEGVRVTAGEQSTHVDRVFVAIGRRPNLGGLGLDRIGCLLDDHQCPWIDPETLQVGRFPIYLAGDATGGVANLQVAAEQGRVAGYNACHDTPIRYRRKVPMAIVFSDPNIATVGASWASLDPDQTLVAQQRFGPVGRALIMGQNRGLMRLYAEPGSGRVLGGSMVGPRCEHLAHLLAWGVQQRLSVTEMLEMPFYHPVIEEALQDALHALARQLEDPQPAPAPSMLDKLLPWRRRPEAAAA
jgi:dihydrolipoamide dehydrogenase